MGVAKTYKKTQKLPQKLDEPQKAVHIQFKVWSPAHDQITYRIFLLGSIPELGGWDIYKALKTEPTKDPHIYRTEVRLPIDSTFEWVWVRALPNRTGINWESSQRRGRTLGCFSGVVHTAWGLPEEVFLQTITSAELTTFHPVKDGQKLVLVGSTENTGAWEVKRAVPAVEFPEKSGYWKATVSFDSQTVFLFKWTVIDNNFPPGETSIVEQEKHHHCMQGRQGMMKAVAAWNQPGVVLVDSGVLGETLDIYLGRTDVIIMEKKRRIMEITDWESSRPSSGDVTQDQIRQIDMSTLGGTSDEFLVPNSVAINPARSTMSVLKNLDSTFSRRGSTETDSIQPEQTKHVKKEKPNKNRVLFERLNRTYTPSCDMSKIKGKGQRPMAEGDTFDLKHHVPLLENGPIIAEVDIMDSELKHTPIYDAIQKESADKANNKLNIRAVPTDDALLWEVECASAKLLTLSHHDNCAHDKDALYESDVSVVASTSMTFSMLQEAEVEKTKHPVIAPRKAKHRLDKNPYELSPRSRPAQVIPVIVPPATANIVSSSSVDQPARSESFIGGPARVGHEDLTKPLREMDEERSHRLMWENQREAARNRHDEEEEEDGTTVTEDMDYDKASPASSVQS